LRLETALETVKIMADRGKGFAVTLHVSPEKTVRIEKSIFVKGCTAKEAAEKLTRQ